MTTSFITNTVSPDLVITTPEQLKQAFGTWMHEYEADPMSFNPVDGDYAENCVSYLLSILTHLNTKGS